MKLDKQIEVLVFYTVEMDGTIRYLTFTRKPKSEAHDKIPSPSKRKLVYCYVPGTLYHAKTFLGTYEETGYKVNWHYVKKIQY